MLYHNILHSDDKRTVKKVILSQERNEEEGTFWEDVGKIKKEIRFKGDIKEMKKSEVKKEVKIRIGKLMVEEMMKVGKEKTKMRFSKVGETFVRKEYTKEDGHLVKQALVTKLNMQPIYRNFKGDWTKSIMCPLCAKTEDTTEHLIQCQETSTIHIPTKYLQEDNNIERWRIINNTIEGRDGNIRTIEIIMMK